MLWMPPEAPLLRSNMALWFGLQVHWTWKFWLLNKRNGLFTKKYSIFLPFFPSMYYQKVNLWRMLQCFIFKLSLVVNAFKILNVVLIEIEWHFSLPFLPLASPTAVHQTLTCLSTVKLIVSFSLLVLQTHRKMFMCMHNVYIYTYIHTTCWVHFVVGEYIVSLFTLHKSSFLGRLILLLSALKCL